MSGAKSEDGVRKRFRRKRIRMAGQPSSMDLIEEGVHLLRQTRLKYWSVYLLGMAPFLLGFLFFWTEMANSGLAEQTLVPGALLVAGLFVWQKVTQVYFAKGLRGALEGSDGAAWGWCVWLRVVREQGFWQPVGLVVLFICSILTVPFAWAYSFFQNLLVGDPVAADEREEGLFAENWRLARVWHDQSWGLIMVLSVVAALTWLNWVTVLMFVPYLLKSLLGIETIFSRAGMSVFNSTTLFACGLLAYAVTDPLVKACFLLRRHYSAARASGADLQLQFRRATRVASWVVALGLIGVFSSGSLEAGVQSSPVERAVESVDFEPVVEVERLDASIDEVLRRREFMWRFPREAVDGDLESKGWLSRLVDKIERWQGRFERWLDRLFSNKDQKNKERGHVPSIDGGFLNGLGQLVSYGLIIGFVLLLLFLGVRAWKLYEPIELTEGASEGDGARAVPDLEDEDVSADLLPRNEWVDLARELIAKGDFRLAIRAYFLAQLSHFSSEGLITIQRAKSNREYARELSRRGHGRAGLLDLYRAQIYLFESVWYGERRSGEAEVSEMEQYLREQGVLG